MTSSRWPLFIRQCLVRRTPGREFQELSDMMAERFPISGSDLTQIIVDLRTSFCAPGDPLIPVYLRVIVTLGLAQPTDLLTVLIRRWNGVNANTNGTKDPESLASDDVAILNSLAELIATDKLSTVETEVEKLLVLLSRWLVALCHWVTIDTTRIAHSGMMSFVEAVGVLLATAMGTDQGTESLKKSELLSKKRKRFGSSAKSELEPRLSVQRALNSSLTLFSTVSTLLFHRLDALQKQFDLFDNISDGDSTHFPGQMQLDALQFEANIIDGPLIHSVSATFVYLDVVLRTSESLDDRRLLNFLNVRHTGNNETMFSELIIGSFNLYATWQSRSEPEISLMKCRHFIVNKLPSILSIISASSFGSFPPDEILSQSLSEITTTFPKLERRIRNTFLQVCALHRLISTESISAAFGEESTETRLTRGLLQKDDIVRQLKSNAHRSMKVVEELQKLEGNSETIANAIVESVHNFCQSKETSSLKDLANAINRQPTAVDIIALFNRPSLMLSSLCTLLDEWNWDELHGESQPVYDEFGNILLLIQIFKYRLGLRNSELGISSSSNFVAKLFQRMNSEQTLANLSATMQNHLGDWINAFFVAEALSDDLTSSCSPQEFYLLVPTLLHQSMLAYECGKLKFETLHGGFDYLLEPFLLPSLIPALFWLGTHARRLHSNKLIAQVLEIFIKPPENNEAKEIHQTIWSVVSPVLTPVLQNEASVSSEAKSVLKTLESFPKSLSSASTSLEEIESWSHATGGILSGIQFTFRALIFWANSSTPIPSPPPTFNSMELLRSLRLYGPDDIIKLFSSELSTLGTETGEYDIGLDIASAMICATEGIDNPSLPLHGALSQQYSHLADILKQKTEKSSGIAESIVRLHRRVELLRHQPADPAADVAAARASFDSNMDMENLAGAGTTNDVANNGSGANATTTNEEISALNAIQSQSQDIDEVLDAAAKIDEMEKQQQQQQQQPQSQDPQQQTGTNNGMDLDMTGMDMDLVGGLDMSGMDGMDMSGMGMDPNDPYGLGDTSGMENLENLENMFSMDGMGDFDLDGMF